MICPRCGEINSDSAGECSRCHHKFSLGHAFNDPAHATYPSFVGKSPGNAKRLNIVGYIVFILLFLALILAIISSFVGF